MAVTYTCRNCGAKVTKHWMSSDDSPFYVHIEERTGLLGSNECYPTPKAEPILG